MWIRVKTYGGAVELTQDDGTQIEKITAVDIRIRPLEPVTAALQFLMPFSDVVVNATVSEKHLRELARRARLRSREEKNVPRETMEVPCWRWKRRIRT